MESSPEGWYKDPYGRMPFRWWDGTNWSPYARGDEVQWDPIASASISLPRPGVPTMGVALGGFAAVGLSFAVLELLRSHANPGGLATELVLTEVALWLPMLGACWFVSRRRGERWGDWISSRSPFGPRRGSHFRRVSPDSPGQRDVGTVL